MGKKKKRQSCICAMSSTTASEMFCFSLHSLIKLHICHGSFSLAVDVLYQHSNKELEWSADILGHFVHIREKAVLST